ncbi:MAG: glycosyltransferase [Terriglobales bacterium]
MNDLSVVVPVYNEAENFPAFWQEVSRCITRPFRAFIAYDFEGDTTVPVVTKLIAAGESRLTLVRNQIRPGVVGAILAGLAQVENGPVLILMADLSDDLTQVKAMLKLYAEGNDLVVGSRYMRGGRMIGGPWLKRTLSRCAGLSLYWLRRLPTHDATNAFKVYDRTMLRELAIESRRGFELNLEITVKAFLAGYRIAEVPSTWRDRTQGASRFRLWAWLPHYLRWYCLAFRPRHQSPRQSKPGNEPTSDSA